MDPLLPSLYAKPTGYDVPGSSNRSLPLQGQLHWLLRLAAILHCCGHHQPLLRRAVDRGSLAVLLAGISRLSPAEHLAITRRRRSTGRDSLSRGRFAMSLGGDSGEFINEARQMEQAADHSGDSLNEAQQVEHTTPLRIPWSHEQLEQPWINSYRGVRT